MSKPGRVCQNPRCKDAQLGLRYTLSTAMDEKTFCSLLCEAQANGDAELVKELSGKKK